MNPTQPRRPAARVDFEIAVICALPIEADAVNALFDHHWGDDDGPAYGKAAGDPNAYSTGAVSGHNVVLAHMPGMGKASAAAVAAGCRQSFPNLKLALVVGICGVVPFRSDGSGTTEIVLGDVIVSDGVVQYDLGRRLPEQFVPKDTLLDTLGRPNIEIRALLAKFKTFDGQSMLKEKTADYLNVLRRRPELAAAYPGAAQDRLFKATDRHVSDGVSCEECACNGEFVPRARLERGNSQPPVVHFGLIASGDTVMKSGEDRDTIARQTGAIGFEMEGAGVWDIAPCVVIKGACDYADSHKTKAWQRYAAATAAACMKAVLNHWVSSLPDSVPIPEQLTGPWFLVPYPRNDSFVGRTTILDKLQQPLLKSGSQARVALYGLGGIGKTQIALEYAYWLHEACSDMSVFWVHASNAERFRQAYTFIAQECRVPGHDDPTTDVLTLVKRWLEKKNHRRWLMVIDNADDTQLFFGQQGGSETGSPPNHEGNLGRYLPECPHGAILITTRNKQTGSRLTKGKRLIEVGKMDENETAQLLREQLDGVDAASSEFSALSSRLEHLPLALVQAAAFIQENTTTIRDYLRLLDKSDQHFVDLLSEEFETLGRDSETPHAVAETWILSFEQVQRQNVLASELLSLMSLFDRQAIPLQFLSHYIEGQQDRGTGGEIQLTKALGVLKAFSFVSEDKSSEFDMHRLLQLVSWKWLLKTGNMSRFTKEALTAVEKSYPFGSYENREICTTLLPHVYAVLKLESTGSRNERLARASLLTCAAALFRYQGQWKDAETFLIEAVGLHRADWGDEHPNTLVSMANLASTYRNQGRWKEGEELEVQVMEMSKKVLGDEHPHTLVYMASLALTYWMQGRLKEAEELDVQAMEISKRVLGDENPDVLTSMASLASIYQSQSRWKEAEELQVQVLEMSKRVLGDEHPDTLRSMDNLALTWKGLGRVSEALELMQNCLRL